MKVRSLTRRDIRAAAALERACGGDDAYSGNQLAGVLLSPRRRCLAGWVGGELAALVVWEKKPGAVAILRVVVRDGLRRKGLASKLLGRALFGNPGATFTATVRERNLATQLLLKKNGFTCENILRKAFDSPPEDGLKFVLGDFHKVRDTVESG